MTDATYTISDASKLIGVSEKTLRLWDKNGKLPADKTDGGHRRYTPEQLRTFLRAGDITPTITDEFLKTDQCIHENYTAKNLKFWKDKGYISDTMTAQAQQTLGLMLSNQMLANKYPNDEHFHSGHDEIMLHTIVAMWDNLKTKNMVSFDAMLGPTGHHNYMCMRKNADRDEYNLCIGSHLIEAVTQKSTTKLLIPQDPLKEMMVVDKDSYTPRKQEVKKYHDYAADLPEDAIAQLNGKALAEEIDTHILTSIFKAAPMSEEPVQRFLNVCPDFLPGEGSPNTDKPMQPTWFTTNEFGLELIKRLDTKLELDETFQPGKHTQVVGTIVDKTLVYNPNIDGILAGFTTKAKTDYAGYFYKFYIPISHTPYVIDPGSNRPRRGLLFRHACGFIPDGHKRYAKIQF